MTDRTNPDSANVLTTGEAAALCGVSFRTVLRWIERGLLPAYKLPGRGDRRIRRIDLHRFMQEHGMTAQETAPRSARRVLIVDDEMAMAHAIDRVLRHAGCETAIATNGFEAGSVLAIWKPEVMTLDLRMPGMDGLAVLRFLAQAEPSTRPKVLIISADSEQRLQSALELGAKAVLRKPFRNEELQDAVAALLG